MLWILGAGSILSDVDAWNPFKGNPEGSPFQYPLYYEPGFDLNSTAPGNLWLPDPHPYADSEPWPELPPQ